MKLKIEINGDNMIIYINYDGIYCSVFKSQIIQYLNAINQNNINIKLINFDKKIYDEKYKEDFLKITNNINYDIKSFKIYGIKSIVLKKYVTDVIKYIEKNLSKKILIICRGQLSGYIGINVKRFLTKKYNDINIKVITDFRGDIIEEYKNVHSNKNILHRILKFFILNRFSYYEKISLRSDYIFFVTNKFKEKITKKYKIDLKNNSQIIPTCVNEDLFKYKEDIRNIMRKKLNINNKFVILYNGSAEKWQLPEKIIETYKNLHKNINNAFLLILTKDKDKFESLIKENNISNEDYKIISCDYNEINKYILCGDLALLLRERNSINDVASPTKFAEYLICHVPVLYTKGIGDIDEIVENYKIGILLDEISRINIELINEIKKINNFDMVIQKYYSLNININKIVNIYKSF